MKKRISESTKITLTIKQLKRLVKENTNNTDDESWNEIKRIAENALASYYVNSMSKLVNIYGEYVAPTVSEVLDDIRQDKFLLAADFRNGDMRIYGKGSTFCITEIEQDPEGNWQATFVELDDNMKKYLRII